MNINLLLLKKLDRQSKNRIIMMIVTVMLGVAIAISYCAAVNALYQRYYRFNRSIYYNTSYKSDDSELAKNKDGLLVKIDGSGGNLLAWGNQKISVAEIALSSDKMKSFYGLTVPKEGTYYVSPQLEKLMNSNPGLKNRLPQGKMVGVIQNDFLQSPNDLTMFRGMSSATKQSGTGVTKITNLVTDQEYAKEISTSKIILVLVGTVTLLFPVMMLISIASQLGSMQKERRYAALRLVGATKGQINRTILTESLFTAIIGTLLGTGLFYLIRPLYGNIPLDGATFFLEDINIGWPTYLVIFAATIILCVVTDMIGMRKMKLSPLGVMKKGKMQKKPRIWRLIPLLAGIGLLIFIGTKDRTWYDASRGNSSLFMMLVLALLLLIMIGLVIAGSYLTRISAKLIARFTKRPVLLLSMKRIEVLSGRTFRAVGGVVIALYVGCFYLSAVGGITDFIAKQSNTTGWEKLKTQSVVIVDDSASKMYSEIKSKSGTSNVLLADYTDNSQVVLKCNQVQTYFENMNCKSSPDSYVNVNLMDGSGLTASAGQTGRNNAILLNISNGTSVDDLRNIVASKTDGGIVDSYSYIASGAMLKSQLVSPIIYELSELAYAAIALTIFISIISLFVSTMGGMLERKASFYNLNLGGVTVKQLRIVMLIESMLPLILVSIIASYLGFVSAQNIMRVMSTLPTVSIPVAYYYIVAGLVLVAGTGVWILSRKVKTLVTVENNQTE